MYNLLISDVCSGECDRQDKMIVVFHQEDVMVYAALTSIKFALRRIGFVEDYSPENMTNLRSPDGKWICLEVEKT